MVAQKVKNLPALQETWVWSLGQEDPLGKGMATHSSMLAWRIPWTERSLADYSPWCCEELDSTYQLNNSNNRSMHGLIYQKVILLHCWWPCSALSCRAILFLPESLPVHEIKVSQKAEVLGQLMPMSMGTDFSIFQFVVSFYSENN